MGRLDGLRDAAARGALVLSVALGVTGLVLGTVVRATFVNVLLALVAALVLPVTLVGAAAVRARAGGLPGWLLLAAGVSLPLATCAYIYAGAAFARDLPGAAWAGWLDGWPWIPAVVLVPTVGVLLYPDGRPSAGSPSS
jgi:ABC-type amino acid transport system permease subunit